ncbi:MAG: TatD family hydrolase [Clostridia bacterium]
MNMNLFDTHTHLLDEQFSEERNALIPSLPNCGVSCLVEVGCEMDDIPKICALVALYDHVYGAVGIHPHTAHTVTPAVLRRIELTMAFPKIVAVGEIGLDYHYDYSPRAVQKQAFADQIAIAKTYRRPIIIHDREAHGDTMDILQSEKNGLLGVLHCYSGSYEDACRYINMGLYIGLGGALTFKNAVKQREIAAKLPLERIVIETDCPYMTPEPHRGERNDPRLLHLTLEKLAEVRNMNADVLAAVTTENAKRLFHID